MYMFDLVILVQLFNYKKCSKRTLFNSSVSTLTTIFVFSCVYATAVIVWPEKHIYAHQHIKQLSN